MRLQAILLAGAIALAGCDHKKEPAADAKPPERPPAPVVVASASAEDVPVYLDEIGRCVARESVTLQPQISGRITHIHFADGQDVKPGDLLFTIDPRPFQAQLAAAEAALAQSKATLDLARTDAARITGLLEKKAAAQQELDAAKNAVAVSEARVMQNQAAVETARLNLEYCTLKSPIEGRTGRRLVDVGNIVKENDARLLMIERLDPIYADFTVTERDLGAVQAGLARGPLRAEVRIPDETGPARPGEVLFLDNAVQEGTGTVLLRATVANADRRLWPGRFVNVRLILDVQKGAVLVPAAAPQISARGPYVYVVTPADIAELRPVQLGQRQGDRIAVSGVKAGERVVVGGHVAVMPGAKVRVEVPKTAEAAK
jgi:multidrug efflux system membrane fusion protein